MGELVGFGFDDKGKKQPIVVYDTGSYDVFLMNKDGTLIYLLFALDNCNYLTGSEEELQSLINANWTRISQSMNVVGRVGNLRPFFMIRVEKVGRYGFLQHFNNNKHFTDRIVYDDGEVEMLPYSILQSHYDSTKTITRDKTLLECAANYYKNYFKK